MKPRLQLKPKTKVRVSTRMRLITVGAAFAVLVATGFFLYYNFGTSSDSMAGKETQLPGFGYRKKITFTGSLNRGNEMLLNFPLLLELNDPDLRYISNGGKMAHKRGYDLRITKADGVSELPSSIESYDPATGKCLVWVLVDSLKANQTPSFQLYYSKATLQTEPANLVWHDKFNGVWHFNNDLHASGNRKLRATSVGTLSAEGKIAGARKFSNENGDFAEYPFSEELNLRDAFTLSAWVYPEEKGRMQVIASNHGDVPGGYALYIDQNGMLNASFVNSAGKRITLDNIGGAEVLETNRWHHVAVAFSIASGKLQTFVNGIADRLLITREAPALTSSPLLIGREKFNEKSGFTGRIDELKISATARTQAWLATEYYTQENSLSLFRLGAEEPLQMDAASIEKNRQALQKIDTDQATAATRMNTLRANRPNPEENPATVTSSAQQMRDKMNNIRKVSDQNSK